MWRKNMLALFLTLSDQILPQLSEIPHACTLCYLLSLAVSGEAGSPWAQGSLIWALELLQLLPQQVRTRLCCSTQENSGVMRWGMDTNVVLRLYTEQVAEAWEEQVGLCNSHRKYHSSMVINKGQLLVNSSILIEMTRASHTDNNSGFMFYGPELV